MKVFRILIVKTIKPYFSNDKNFNISIKMNFLNSIVRTFILLKTALRNAMMVPVNIIGQEFFKLL